ncbi:MAG: hypothetical protein EOO12_06240 [Chitinophagaceae bacterium]|nr:MAG: hypothetical protein EOO12_06240 [Chitinophagaceae bacterium]
MKLRILAFTALALLGITACKKDSSNDDDNETVVTEQLTQHSDDQSRVSTDLEAVDNDINAAIESDPAFGRVNNTARTLVLSPCDATVAFDSSSTQRVMIITFNGAPCDSFRTRTGTIYVMQPRAQRWGQPGATLRDSIVNLKITRRSDNKSITINGTRTHTNVSGGRLGNMPVGGTIVHTVEAAMSITFDNGSQRQWQAARKRTYTHPAPTVLNIAISGNHSDGGVNDIAEWGTNRFGNAFRTRITSPLVFRSECHFRLGAGTVLHTGLAHSLEVTYGLNIQGQPTGCPGNNPYYFKAVWTRANGNVMTVIRPYY